MGTNSIDYLQQAWTKVQPGGHMQTIKPPNVAPQSWRGDIDIKQVIK